MKNELDTSDNPRQMHDYLLRVVHMTKQSVVLMGKALFYLKKDDNFKKAVGQGADTWADYLRQPEIGLSTNESSRLIQVYEYLVLKFGYDETTISEIPTKNLHYLLPLVKKLKSKDEVDALVADATLLSQHDFRERVYDKRVEDGDASRTYEYLIMKKTIETGLMSKVHDITSDMIRSSFNLE